jgi:hypothetical protein
MAEVAARLEPWAQEAGALPSQQLTKSPWMPPPLPTGNEEDDDQDTHIGSDGYDDDSRSGSQVSQPTGAVSASGQETQRPRRVKPPPLKRHIEAARRGRRRLAVSLAVAIPLSILLGGLLTLLVVQYLL